MTKGKIVLIPFPFTDLSCVKVRPACVLYAHKKGDDCIVAFLTSKQKKVFDCDIKLTADEVNGLKGDSILKLDKIATLQKKIVIGEIGELCSGDVKRVDQKLTKMFGL